MTTYYYVGNGAVWNNNYSWSLTSGGGAVFGARPSTSTDVAVFDSNSTAFLSGSGQLVVNCNNNPITVGSIIADGSLGSGPPSAPIYISTSTPGGAINASVYGDIKLASNVAITGNVRIYLYGTSSGNVIQTGGFNSYIWIIHIKDGVWTVLNNGVDFRTASILIEPLTTGNVVLNIPNTCNIYGQLWDNTDSFPGASASQINLSGNNGTWYADYWRVRSPTTLNMGGVNISMYVAVTTPSYNTFYGGGKTYNNVTLTGEKGYYGTVYITGSNTFKQLIYNRSVNGEFIPGGFAFENGSTTIVDNITGSGWPYDPYLVYPGPSYFRLQAGVIGDTTSTATIKRNPNYYGTNQGWAMGSNSRFFSTAANDWVSTQPANLSGFYKGTSSATAPYAASQIGDYVEIVGITALPKSTATISTLNTLTTSSTAQLQIQATSSNTLATASVSSTSALQITASASNTFSALTGNAAAALQISAAASNTFSDLSISSTATAPVSASCSSTLDVLTCLSDGISQVTGSVSLTLSSVTGTVTAVLPIQAVASPSLSALTSDITASISNTGAVTASLGAATLTSSGTLQIIGTTTSTLDAVTFTSASVIKLNAVASNTLGVLTGTAAASLPIYGSMNASMSVFVSASEGIIVDPIHAAGSPTLQTLSIATTGSHIVAASLSSSLAALTFSAAGGPVVGASLSATLATLTGSSASVAPVGAVVSKTLDSLSLTTDTAEPGTHAYVNVQGIWYKAAVYVHAGGAWKLASASTNTGGSWTI